MSTLTTVAAVLEQVETDLPDTALQRLLETAEVDVRSYASKVERASLPAVVWDIGYDAAIGVSDGSLTLPTSIRGYPIARFEGRITPASGDPVSFELDTPDLETDESGTATLALTDAGTFDVTVSEDGLTLTIDTTSATKTFTLDRLLGLQTGSPPPPYVSAVIDLVKLGAQYEGPESERTGSYTVTFADYHRERNRVLERLMFSGNGSILT